MKKKKDFTIGGLPEELFSKLGEELLTKLQAASVRTDLDANALISKYPEPVQIAVLNLLNGDWRNVKPNVGVGLGIYVQRVPTDKPETLAVKEGGHRPKFGRD